MSAPDLTSPPLAGVRILEFTTAWAGPFAGRALAYLGADVIKVEAPQRPDAWRGPPNGGAEVYYPDLDPGDDPQNSNVLFNSQNLDKRSIGLDVKAPGAREVVLDLVRRSDVILANFTPGVLRRLGLSRDDLAAVNDRIIVVEMPAFGPGGPTSHHQGMGKTMEPAAGMTALMAYGDGTPVLTGPAFMDPTGGLNAVAAVVSALELRERTGHGSSVLVPQVEAAAAWIGEYLLEQAETGRAVVPDGNRVRDAAPHNAYACAGDNSWVVIGAQDDDQWRILCETLGLTQFAHRADLSSLAGRRANEDEIDAAISAVVATADKGDVAKLLQAAGVLAAPVLDGAEVASGQALRDVGMVVDLTHPSVGRRSYGSLGFRHSRTPGGHHRAAPTFGQHNDEVLGDLLGYDAARIAQLRTSAVLADRPTADPDAIRPIAESDPPVSKDDR